MRALAQKLRAELNPIIVKKQTPKKKTPIKKTATKKAPAKKK
jgi:hypothetical protein